MIASSKGSSSIIFQSQRGVSPLLINSTKDIHTSGCSSTSTSMTSTPQNDQSCHQPTRSSPLSPLTQEPTSNKPTSTSTIRKLQFEAVPNLSFANGDYFPHSNSVTQLSNLHISDNASNRNTINEDSHLLNSNVFAAVGFSPMSTISEETYTSCMTFDHIEAGDTYEKINNVRINTFGEDLSKLTWAYQNV